MDFQSMLAEFQKSATNLPPSPPSSTLKPPSSPPRKRPITTTTRSPILTIYLACPPPHKIQTGGPEAMHQLCHKINSTSVTISAEMLYISPPHNFTPTSTASTYYSHYDAPYCTDVRDTPSALVIWPEIWTRFSESFGQYSRRAIWWLSVDNNDSFDDWDDETIWHLYQSEYARNHLTQHGVSNMVRMTEYIPSYRVGTMEREKEVDVVYNPVKGMHYTDEIIQRCGKNVTFCPIGGKRRLDPLEVVELLEKSKVYIDFGHHPGMDRLPREATLCGCIVITNKEGAARFRLDVPIPEQYKIEEFDVEKVYKLLRDVLRDYDEKRKDFDEYRDWIGEQEKAMEICVEKFLEILGKEGENEENEQNEEEEPHKKLKTS